MDRRRESRVETQLSVRMWGLDQNSRPFIQLVRVRNISSEGAVMQGVRSQIKPGEVVDVQYDGNKAQFRVVWAGKTGTEREGEIGVEKLPSEPHIWDVSLDRCAQFVGEG